jgi:DNA-binding NarL/FixJ family response regulator
MHLMVADDHRLVLDALQAYLTKIKPDIEITVAADFEQALQCAEQSTGLDLVILDMNMPGMNGLRGLGVMRERFPGLPVVLLSGQASGAQVRDALREGASGFIPKDLSGEAMLMALELVLSGETYVPAVALADNGARRSEFPGDNPLSSLTHRELEVLSLLIEGRSNKSIAHRLGLKHATVAFHLKSVFRKLNVASRTEAVSAGIKLGLANG